MGLLTFGTAVQKTEDVALRAASGAPFGVALGGAMWARFTRSKLRALRHETDVTVADASGLPARDEGSGSSPKPPAHS